MDYWSLWLIWELCKHQSLHLVSGYIGSVHCYIAESVYVHAVLFLSVLCRGAAISLTLSITAAPLMIILYIWVRGLHKLTWGGWSWESLQQWGQFIKLAVPGLLMITFEFWSFEIITFIAGSISKTELAVNAVWFQIIVILFMVSLPCLLHALHMHTCTHLLLLV